MTYQKIKSIPSIYQIEYNLYCIRYRYTDMQLRRGVKTPESFHDSKTYDYISNYLLDLIASILCNNSYIKFYTT